MKHGMTLLLLAALATPVASYAADEKAAMTDEQLSRMQEKLELSDAQVAEMRQIRDEGGSRKEMRAVLNEEQKAQSKEMKKARKEEKGKKQQKQKQEQNKA